jgi:hypothetical protein
MGFAAKLLTPGMIFLLTLASGFWLSRSGKPLKTGIFTVHKLIALAAVVVTALQTYKSLRILEVQPLVVALLFVIGLCAAALFVTGALMSAEKPGYRSLLMVHKIAPLLAVVAGALVIYLFSGRSRG